jgi:2-aminoethylphosphonate dioxygenase
LDELREKPPGESKEAMYYERSLMTDEKLLVRVEHVLGDHNPEITILLVSPKAIECLTDLFNEPPILFKEKINYKLPGCRPDKLHQDQAAGWNAYSDFFITMGIVVDANRKDNAALSFMKSGNYEKNLMTEEWQPLTEEDPPYQPMDEYVLLEADPGDVIFFDCYVPHGSPANNSTRSRRNIFLTFNRQSDGDMRNRYYTDKWKTYPPNDLDHARSNDSYRV